MFRMCVAVSLGLVCSGTAVAQLPPNPQRDAYLRALEFRQMAARQLMYPTPISPWGARTNYLQFMHSLARINDPSIAPLPPEITAIQERAQAIQFRVYPQLLSPAADPLNYLEVRAARGLGSEVPLPVKLPPSSDLNISSLYPQGATVDFERDVTVATAHMLRSGLGNPRAEGIIVPFQGLARVAKAVNQRQAKAKRAEMGPRLNALMFREAPGERELELAWMWHGADQKKARQLFELAERRAGPGTAIAIAARKALAQMDNRQ